MVRFYAKNTAREELKISSVLCVEVFRSVSRLTIGPTIQTLIPRSGHAKVHNFTAGRFVLHISGLKGASNKPSTSAGTIPSK